MKKSILIGASLLVCASGHSQYFRTGMPSAPVNRSAELAAQAELAGQTAVGSGAAAAPVESEQGKPASYNWSLLCGSANAYGMLSSNQKPLQYIAALDWVSFIHRKSATYQESPAMPASGANGVIVAEISSNGGTTFDSTCIYANPTDWGRYPQGAIYNPSGNTAIGNAYVVGSGPTVGASSFTGSWYASKKLNAFTNSPSTAPGAQQFYTFGGGPYPPNMPKHAWPRTGFQITNDGVIHALGILGDNLAGTSSMRGYAVITGTFNQGTSTVDWKIDSIIPPARLQTNGNYKNLDEGQMVWNPAGTIGYVVGTGILANATKANCAKQPIVYKIDKTQGSSATWTLMSQLDFNSTFSVVATRLPGRPVKYPAPNGDTTAMPFINDFDLAVDANDNLHIGVIFMSGYSDHPDSMNYYVTFQSQINPGNSYKWGHIPGWRPYIYDFIGNGVAPWKMVDVDTMSSEGPGTQTSSGGYNENPWDNTGTNGSKLAVEGRLQLSRTPDGQYITFSWCESDTLFTSSGLKYNNLPDLKVRAMALSSYTGTYVMDIGPKINVTGGNNNVRTRATLHYMAPISSTATVIPSTSNAYTVEIMIPLSVTNSNPFAQLTNNATWFGKNTVPFRFRQASTVGLSEQQSLLDAIQIYPNPAQTQIVLGMVMDASEKVNVNVLNAMGQQVRTISSQVPAGQSNLRMDLQGLAPGIYFVKVTTGQAETTRKLVIE